MAKKSKKSAADWRRMAGAELGGKSPDDLIWETWLDVVRSPVEKLESRNPERGSNGAEKHLNLDA